MAGRGGWGGGAPAAPPPGPPPAPGGGADPGPGVGADPGPGVGVELDPDAGSSGRVDRLREAPGEPGPGPGGRRGRRHGPGRGRRAPVAQDGEHAPQAVGGLAGGGLDVVQGAAQAVGGGLEAPGHGAAHGDGAQVPGHGVVQLAGDDEAVLGHRARGRLLRQAPLVDAPVAPSQPQGGGDETRHGENHRHLNARGGGRVDADEEADADDERGGARNGASERGVAREGVEGGHAVSLGGRPGGFIEPGSDGPGSETPARYSARRPMRAAARRGEGGLMISIENLVKRHGEREVLHGVSLQARPGRVTGFAGPNGAGKSSTLRCLLGLDRADGGRALIGGRPYRELREPLRVVGAMLDGSGAHPSRTARGHLAWVASGSGIGRRRVNEVLDAVGLGEAAGRRVGTFSLGMGQRLGLAAALLGDPEVLILDEPVNGLDPEGIRWIRTLLRRRADAGGTVLLSSHVLAELAEVADDVVVIAHGRVRAAGTLTEIAAGHSSLEEAFFSLTGGEFGGRAGVSGRAGLAGRPTRAEGVRA